MSKYLVVTPNKIIGYNNHKEAFNYYELQCKPCGVYEVFGMIPFKGTEKGLNIDVVCAINVKAEFHSNIESPECFLHLQAMLNNNNYKEGTR